METKLHNNTPSKLKYVPPMLEEIKVNDIGLQARGQSNGNLSCTSDCSLCLPDVCISVCVPSDCVCICIPICICL